MATSFPKVVECKYRDPENASDPDPLNESPDELPWSMNRSRPRLPLLLAESVVSPALSQYVPPAVHCPQRTLPESDVGMLGDDEGAPPLQVSMLEDTLSIDVPQPV